jgi:hypothetical protein
VAIPGRLPYHLRAVQITLPWPATSAASNHRAPISSAAYPPPRPLSLLAIDSHGKIIRPDGDPQKEAPPNRILWWHTPRPTPTGACAINAHGLPGLIALGGHIATALPSYPGKIVGRAFYSCIDTEYELHNSQLQAAILLDAQHPKQPAAEIPGLHPLPRTPAFFNGPGDSFHGEQTATRRGNAWLLLTGGHNPNERIELLRHLDATVNP